MPRPKLQFGHGGEAVENNSDSLTSPPSALRFNSATAVRPWRTSIADPLGRASSTLQLGHGGEAVENEVLAWPETAAFLLLQFGHGGEAVENSNEGRHGGRTPLCFNSATAV